MGEIHKSTSAVASTRRKAGLPCPGNCLAARSTRAGARGSPENSPQEKNCDTKKQRPVFVESDLDLGACHGFGCGRGYRHRHPFLTAALSLLCPGLTFSNIVCARRALRRAHTRLAISFLKYRALERQVNFFWPHIARLSGAVSYSLKSLGRPTRSRESLPRHHPAGPPRNAVPTGRSPTL